jgi:hypothetical protein
VAVQRRARRVTNWLQGLDKFFATEFTLPSHLLDPFRPYLDKEGPVTLSADTAPEVAGARRASLSRKNPEKFRNVTATTKSLEKRSNRPVRWPVVRRLKRFLALALGET